MHSLVHQHEDPEAQYCNQAWLKQVLSNRSYKVNAFCTKIRTHQESSTSSSTLLEEVLEELKRCNMYID